MELPDDATLEDATDMSWCALQLWLIVVIMDDTVLSCVCYENDK